eukprot:TCONS_00044193-protein
MISPRPIVERTQLQFHTADTEKAQKAESNTKTSTNTQKDNTPVTLKKSPTQHVPTPSLNNFKIPRKSTNPSKIDTHTENHPPPPKLCSNKKPITKPNAVNTTPKLTSRFDPFTKKHRPLMPISAPLDNHSPPPPYATQPSPRDLKKQSKPKPLSTSS